MNRLKEIMWKINDYLERKPKVVFSVSFYLVYFILCLIKLGILWVGLSLLFSLFVLAIVAGAGGRKRYSVIRDYYWTEPKVTTDFGILHLSALCDILYDKAMMKNCEQCKKEFKTSRSVQRFCGNDCRLKWLRRVMGGD